MIIHKITTMSKEDSMNKDCIFIIKTYFRSTKFDMSAAVKGAIAKNNAHS